MDSFASLALATEPPTLELLNRLPYLREEYIISRKMFKNLMVISVFQIVITYIVVFAGEYFFPEPDEELRFGRPGYFVYPGRVKNWDGTPLWSEKE